MAHSALSGAASRRPSAYERLPQGAACLAAAVSDPVGDQAQDWGLRLKETDSYVLFADLDGFLVELLQRNAQAPVPQGQGRENMTGYSGSLAGQFRAPPGSVVWPGVVPAGD